MPYSNKEDFLLAIKESDLAILCDGVNAGGGFTSPGLPPVIDNDILDAAIGKADSLIDGYLASAAVTVPLTTIPPVITGFSVDIALYNLHTRIQFDHIPDFVLDRYNAAVQYLKDVAAGKVNLNISSADISDKISAGGNEKKFSRNMF